jgi:acetylornithine deacetylase/succinyl-diaminopimelate desuccinylase-like protein
MQEVCSRPCRPTTVHACERDETAKRESRAAEPEVRRDRESPAPKRGSSLSGTLTLRNEVTRLLQELIRVDTVNPPGNETAAAELLRAYLEESGVECELYARSAERANLVARIPGRGGPRLALLSHTDTVLADASEWELDPWSGDVRDGEVWGRGALDMKGEVAASAVAVASLARESFQPTGDLIFVAAADEEINVGYGLSWLCSEHPEAVRAEYALNEGAGERIDLGGRRFYLAATAEKMSAPFVLRTRGRSGHASIPSIADNALLKALPLVEALGAHTPAPRHTPETEAFFRAVTGDVPPAEEAAARAAALHDQFGLYFQSLLAPTYSPTMVRASKQRNVIPSVCEVTVDSRLLPGQTPQESEALVRDLLGPDDYELEWIEATGGTRSPHESRLWDAIVTWVHDADPEAGLAPICLSGFTDSHWVREAFGTVAYGFFPMREMPAEVATLLIHSANERIPVADLELAVDFYRFAAQTLLAQ